MRRLRRWFLPAFSLFLAFPAWGGEPGLVAHYPFDEGSGSVARDASGSGCDGRIHGARHVRQGSGYCLEFDGIGDFVDCGSPPALDLRKQATLEAWVHPRSRVQGEPGILGKHFESYLLSYYADGKCWWYISGGGNSAKSLLTPGSWHHLTGTFDGRTLTLYVDGRPVSARASKAAVIEAGKRFFIGCVAGDPEADDPAYTRTAYFPGKIDEVKVYSRALSAAEVRSHFRAGIARLSLAAPYRPARPVRGIRAGRAALSVSRQGQIQIRTGRGGPYLIESAYSYPGERIGWNHLAGEAGGSETRWRPRIRAASSRLLRIEAQGSRLRLQRKVFPEPGRIRFEDRLTNHSREPVGLLLRHTLTAPAPFRSAFSPGVAENPTLFLAGSRERLGVLIEDNLFRLRFEPGLGLPDNQARLAMAGMTLQPDQGHTFRWSLYLLPEGAGYFDFINQVRRDWKANFTVDGPFAFFDIASPILNDPPALRAYLKRKKLRIAALTPWLDYDPGSFDRVWPRPEYRERMRRAIRALKSADPAIRCVGCIETDWVTIVPKRIPGGEQLPQAGGAATGNVRLTPEQTKIIDRAHLPWRDSVKRDADGNLTLELYTRGGRPQTALSVYPAPGNAQDRFLMGQVKFLLDEVGFDGFYIDEFSQGWFGSAQRAYGVWDGVSAEINPGDGKIGQRYTDCSLAGIGSRVRLCRYALRRGKIVVANTYATSGEEQALPVQRFSETQESFDPFAVKDGQEPPAVSDLFNGHLASPIGLGIVSSGQKDTARRIMKAVVAYLRHATLYYHYAIEDIPQTGEGSGAYGPINRMFPITPVRLGKGWIEGREKTITCVSGVYLRKGRARPAVRLFGLDGRDRPPQCTVSRTGGGWKVRIRLRDWAEIAVMEE
ncbi:MAG: LamG domain-containing protein [Armatimonadetes bacterium]|nr:LamG domain-containing protein [Armatimonadota bacterium]